MGLGWPVSTLGNNNSRKGVAEELVCIGKGLCKASFVRLLSW